MRNDSTLTYTTVYCLLIVFCSDKKNNKSRVKTLVSFSWRVKQWKWYQVVKGSGDTTAWHCAEAPHSILKQRPSSYKASRNAGTRRHAASSIESGWHAEWDQRKRVSVCSLNFSVLSAPTSVRAMKCTQLLGRNSDIWVHNAHMSSGRQKAALTPAKPSEQSINLHPVVLISAVASEDLNLSVGATRAINSMTAKAQMSLECPYKCINKRKKEKRTYA